MKKNIKISSNFNEAIKRRYEKYFRFNNSQYWKQYYFPKIKKNDYKREKLYAEILRKRLPKHSIVADVGSGYGFLAKELYMQGLNVICVDLFDEMLAEARENLKGMNITFIKADILDLPFKEQSIDCITLESVIEHFPLKEVKEDILPYLSKIIKKDGYLFIHAPVKSFHSVLARIFRKFIQKDLPIWAIDDDGDVTHKIWIEYTEYIKIIENYGFELVNVDFRTTRSNMKPKVFYHVMKNIQNFLGDSDEIFLVSLKEEDGVKYLKKLLKSNLALTSYLLFRKKI